MLLKFYSSKFFFIYAVRKTKEQEETQFLNTIKNNDFNEFLIYFAEKNLFILIIVSFLIIIKISIKFILIWLIIFFLDESSVQALSDFLGAIIKKLTTLINGLDEATKLLVFASAIVIALVGVSLIFLIDYIYNLFLQNLSFQLDKEILGLFSLAKPDFFLKNNSAKIENLLNNTKNAIKEIVSLIVQFFFPIITTLFINILFFVIYIFLSKDNKIMNERIIFLTINLVFIVLFLFFYHKSLSDNKELEKLGIKLSNDSRKYFTEKMDKIISVRALLLNKTLDNKINKLNDESQKNLKEYLDRSNKKQSICILLITFLIVYIVVFLMDSFKESLVGKVALAAREGVVPSIFFSFFLSSAAFFKDILLVVVFSIFGAMFFSFDMSSFFSNISQHSQYITTFLNTLQSIECDSIFGNDNIELNGSFIMKNVGVSKNGHTIISNINMVVEPGNIIPVLGPSGIGKSLILGTFVRFNEADGLLKLGYTHLGRNLYMDIKQINPQYLRSKILYIPQGNDAIFSENIYLNLTFGLDCSYSIEDIFLSAKEFGINNIIEKYIGAQPDSLNDATRFFQEASNIQTDRLSGGEKQKILLTKIELRLRLGHNKMILADETFGALDPKNVQEFFNKISELCKKYNSTFIIITHDTTIAINPYVSHVTIMRKDGNLFGTKEQILQTDPFLNSYYHNLANEISFVYPDIIFSDSVDISDGITDFDDFSDFDIDNSIIINNDDRIPNLEDDIKRLNDEILEEEFLLQENLKELGQNEEDKTELIINPEPLEIQEMTEIQQIQPIDNNEIENIINISQQTDLDNLLIKNNISNSEEENEIIVEQNFINYEKYKPDNKKQIKFLDNIMNIENGEILDFSEIELSNQTSILELDISSIDSIDNSNNNLADNDDLIDLNNILSNSHLDINSDENLPINENVAINENVSINENIAINENVGNRINSDGNRINDGNMINSDGNRINSDGNMINSDGDMINSDGNMNNSDGNMINSDGNMINSDGNMINDETIIINEDVEIINEKMDQNQFIKIKKNRIKKNYPTEELDQNDDNTIIMESNELIDINENNQDYEIKNEDTIHILEPSDLVKHANNNDQEEFILIEPDLEENSDIKNDDL